MLIPFGFLASAGGAAGAYELISTSLVSSSVASVTFTSGGAWAGYKHLQLRYTARVTTDDYGFKIGSFNGDAGANYAWHRILGGAGSVQVGASPDQSFILMPVVVSTANLYGAGITDILDHNSTTKNKVTRTLGGLAVGSDQIALISGLWRNTAALTSFTVIGYSNFVAGSRFSLYGIKG